MHIFSSFNHWSVGVEELEFFDIWKPRPERQHICIVHFSYSVLWDSYKVLNCSYITYIIAFAFHIKQYISSGIFQKLEKSCPRTLQHNPKGWIIITEIFVRNKPPREEHELNTSLCSPEHWAHSHLSPHTTEHPRGPGAEEPPCIWHGWDGLPAAVRSPSPYLWTQILWQSG